MLPTAQDYFASYGIKMDVSQDALFYIADKATENPRLGARALKEVFGKIMQEYEFDPMGSGDVKETAEGKVLTIDLPTVKRIYGDDED